MKVSLEVKDLAEAKKLFKALFELSEMAHDRGDEKEEIFFHELGEQVLSQTETVLERWERTPHPPFVAKPRYYTVGDFVTYYKTEERCTAFQLNPYVEIYHNDQDECVGIRIMGVKKLVGAGEFSLEHLLQAAVSKCRLVPVEELELINLISSAGPVVITSANE